MYMKKIRVPRWVSVSMPLWVSMFSFALLIIAVVRYTNHRQDLWEKDVKARLFEILVAKKNRLEQALYSRVYYTRSVAAYVSLRPDVTREEFFNLAGELIKGDSVISTMSLAPDCVIGAVFPEKGHEAALGLNLLQHPQRRDIVEKTIQTRESFVAGPVELIEGGVAFISYTPIFDKTAVRENDFWGVTDIVISRDRLLQQASLSEQEGGYLFALRGYNGSGNQGQVWWGQPEVFAQEPILVDIVLPYGTWALGAVPAVGWASYLDQDHVLLYTLVVGAAIISVLIWLISRAMMKIRMNELELNAIFRSMDSVIMEFDQDGRYVKIPPMNISLLFLPREQLLHRTVYDVFPPETAGMFHEGILRCLHTRQRVLLEYPLIIGGVEKWFSVRICWKSEKRVIYHALDITEQRKAQQELLRSEQRFKELNLSKDRFFSIIAHDLRSPFQAILGAAQLLRHRQDSLEPEEQSKLIALLDESARNTFDLLENLLLWARSQGDKLTLSKDSYRLRNLAEDAIAPFVPASVRKNLSVQMLVPDDLCIFADRRSLMTVIGNLFSNAIKYTPAGGRVEIRAIQGPADVRVEVVDTGVHFA